MIAAAGSVDRLDAEAGDTPTYRVRPDDAGTGPATAISPTGTPPDDSDPDGALTGPR
ncbi:hypothetical protein ACSDR0_17625 [Streptosporangium sp. G11]|uniref:hypothetical protein n=1 Tax=Streptosporangium sp. G11 TaxID=3436926 RepID=UPI003EB86821